MRVRAHAPPPRPTVQSSWFTSRCLGHLCFLLMFFTHGSSCRFVLADPAGNTASPLSCVNRTCCEFLCVANSCARRSTKQRARNTANPQLVPCPLHSVMEGGYKERSEVCMAVLVLFDSTHSHAPNCMGVLTVKPASRSLEHGGDTAVVIRQRLSFVG